MLPKILLSLPALAMSLSAQTWTANAATAVPNFPVTGIVKTTTVDTTAHGRGVQPRMTQEGTGTSLLYVPVTAPQNSAFGCIGLRAADNSPTGAIRIEFYRQPRDANPGPAVLLAAVSSHDAPGDGFQFDQQPFAAQVINYTLNTYYIRILMSYQSSSAVLIPSPITFDVSLSGNCNTTPIPGA